MQLQVPQHSEEIKVSFPAEHVLLLTLNRPKALNAMTPAMDADIDRILTWVEEVPSIWVSIITGEGRAFCAGADLIAWNKRAHSTKTPESECKDAELQRNGFGAISRRQSWCKPLIAAVNGGTYGGGTELVLNCDIVVASEDAVFATPEVKRGVVAIMGVIPRLARVAGHQLAAEMLLLGRNVTAQEAATRFGFVNKVVPKAEVVKTAVEWAQEIVGNSPDSVQSTKRALMLASQLGDVEDVVVAHTRSKEMLRVYGSENLKAGLRAFSEKKKPVWKNPAKL
ncbi:enoyl-CoA hydratase/carnithine racemase [Phanerochaete sordida]|uniref:Enoyl-CoA hydratase/carnithine racemase n=1 Tax=Phanerochaete sordida TaxID=48140 RepID=A0A9P3L8L7_9APHY|nr:enoyl-CoA hydratase/carnithine racemase [Phanerochaete sordida]